MLPRIYYLFQSFIVYLLDNDLRTGTKTKEKKPKELLVKKLIISHVKNSKVKNLDFAKVFKEYKISFLRLNIF